MFFPPVSSTKKAVFFSLFSIFFLPDLNAQSESDYEPCSYYGEELDTEIKMYPASDQAKKVIGGVISVLGLKPNFEIRQANVPNAAAVILDHKRYILYNGEFMDQISEASGTYWGGISILAHEIGHHLNGHTLDEVGNRPETELEADEFSGFVLCKMGATLKESQAAIAIAASVKGSPTHPRRADRLNAIAGGWKNANRPGDSNLPRQHTESPVLVRNENRDAESIANHIAFDVHFASDRNGTYYITTKGNLVNVDEESMYLIGSLSESNKNGYRLMLTDKNYNYLYIAPGGNIENGSGKTVGVIKPHTD